MNTKVLTSIIVSLSVAFTSASASVRMKHVYVPVLSPAHNSRSISNRRTIATDTAFEKLWKSNRRIKRILGW